MTTSPPLIAPPTLEALYSKAVELYDQFQFELAVKFLCRIQDLAPRQHIDSLSLLATIYIEESRCEEAKQVCLENESLPSPLAPSSSL
jgi:hypothetical protein